MKETVKTRPSREYGVLQHSATLEERGFKKINKIVKKKTQVKKTSRQGRSNICVFTRQSIINNLRKIREKKNHICRYSRWQYCLSSRSLSLVPWSYLVRKRKRSLSLEVGWSLVLK